MKTIVCKKCGGEFEGIGTQKYCADCKASKKAKKPVEPKSEPKNETNTEATPETVVVKEEAKKEEVKEAKSDEKIIRNFVKYLGEQESRFVVPGLSKEGIEKFIQRYLNASEGN